MVKPFFVPFFPLNFYVNFLFYVGLECPTSDPSLPGLVIDGVCVCPSGFYGDLCENEVDASCQALTPAYDKSAPQPVINPAGTFLQTQTLQVQLVSPLVVGRYVTQILFGVDSIPECEYPVSTSWAKTVDSVGCQDVFTFNMNWIDALTVRILLRLFFLWKNFVSIFFSFFSSNVGSTRR